MKTELGRHEGNRNFANLFVFLTETMKMFVMFDRNFFTVRIVVMRMTFPIKPKIIKTKARIAAINVA